jgi:hypothetical protein
MDFLAAHWKDLLELAGLFGGLWKFFDSRASELAWKRTETLFSLGQQFASDPDIAQATQLIEGRLPGVVIDQLFDDQGQPYDDLHGARLWQVDKYLDFLDRIAYAYRRMRTLSLAEVAIFGAYFQYVHRNARLRAYCADHGYTVVADVAREVDELPVTERPSGHRAG